MASEEAGTPRVRSSAEGDLVAARGQPSLPEECGAARTDRSDEPLVLLTQLQAPWSCARAVVASQEPCVQDATISGRPRSPARPPRAVGGP